MTLPAATLAKLDGIRSRIHSRAADYRKAAPQVAAGLDMFRTFFKSAAVTGFSEGGAKEGDPDIFEKATPIGWWCPAGKEPKGPGISRGKSLSLAANPTGEK